MTEREKERMIKDLKEMKIEFGTESARGYNYAIDIVMDYIKSIRKEDENE